MPIRVDRVDGVFVEREEAGIAAPLDLEERSLAAQFADLADDIQHLAGLGHFLAIDRQDLVAALDAAPIGIASGHHIDNLDAVASLAKENSCPIGVKASNLEETAELTEKLTAAGLNDIVIDPGSRTVRQAFEDEVVIRNAALAAKYRPLGFPTITFPGEMTDNPLKEALIAATFIAKYAGVIVLSDLYGESLFPLLVERMNIYTDPQRPLATEQGIYEIGNPADNAPVLITTNFALTYFIVSGEIEGSKVTGYLLIMDTEGLSVMTAWAAGKFVADLIGPFVKKSGIEDKVKHRKLVIPGYAAAESGGLEEELPDWEIMVGPREAAHIPAYLKSWTP